MLYKQTVNANTLAILATLQQLPELQSCYLAGGTALALRYGHRTSVDLDLFSVHPLEKANIITAIEEAFGNRFEYSGNPVTWAVFGFIDDVKIDILHYNHPMLAAAYEEDGVIMYDLPDIAAMKVKAVYGRGVKKDFWDIYELLHHFSIQQLIDFYEQKFPSQMMAISIPQTLIYFADAEESEEPVSLKGQTWSGVKKFIQKKVSDYLR